MKRFFFPILAAAFMVAALAPHAEARWHQKEIYWQISGVGGHNGTSIWVRDTTHTSIGPVDTTGDFSLDDAVPLERGAQAPGVTATMGALSDTTVIAWIVITPDTSANLTPALTAITAMIDGKVGAYGNTPDLSGGWVKADSAAVSGGANTGMLTGDDTVALPIRTISPYGNIFRFGMLRARITGTGGATGIPAARVFVRYWKED